MDRSLLGALPAELRNIIYRYALCDTNPITVHCQAATYSHVPCRYHFLPGLLVTCKQARKESAGIFLKEDTFQLQINPTQATDLLRLYQDDVRHLWNFLTHLRLVGLPNPTKVVVRIRRSYSHVAAKADRSKYGREILNQFNQITQLAAEVPGLEVVCRLQASWGISIAESGDISIASGMLDSVHREMITLQDATQSSAFPLESMAASFLWTNLAFIHWKYADVCACLNKKSRKGVK